MDSRLLMLGGLVALGGGYLVYGRFLARVLGVDAARPTPAHTKQDGVDYVPVRHWLVLFGHHFSSICGAGPIVGPALAVAYWGWAPTLAWIVLGAILLGAVADFSSLVLAVRHGGVSISEVTGAVVSRRARTFFSIFVLVALVLVLAVFGVLTAGIFVSTPEVIAPSWGILPVSVAAGFVLYRGRPGAGTLVAVTLVGLAAIVALLVAGQLWPPGAPDVFGLEPQTFWLLLLLGYAFLASVLPVQYLLQPRDYLSSFILFAAIGCGVVGVFVTGAPVQAEAFRAFTPEDWPIAGSLYPMLLVTVACGAISGFHSLVSSGTTCKQLGSEAHACRIGYGGMLTESLVAVLVLVSVAAGLTFARHAELLRGPGGAIAAFSEGYGAMTQWLFGGYGATFAAMALNFFILTTLDTATRLGRYLVQEVTGWNDRYLPTALVVVAAGALALTGRWRALWPAFGASNQLVGALALLVVSCWLLQSGRRVLPTLIPSLLMLATTMVALSWQLAGALGPFGAVLWRPLEWLGLAPAASAAEPNWFMAAVCSVLIVLALLVVFEAWGSTRRLRLERLAAEPAG